MMRAGINNKSNPLVVVGLSEENILRLKNGMPIRATFRSFGVELPGDLMICYGPTEMAFRRILTDAGLITPETETSVDPRLVADEALRERHIGENVLICTVGYPRSGKTTWAQSQAYPIVNPDSIRLALHGQRYVVEAEPYVWAIAHSMVQSLFLAGHKRVILDACNNSRKRRDDWRSDKFATFFRYVDTSFEVCRDRALEIGDSAIVKVIERMRETFEPLGDDEERWP